MKKYILFLLFPLLSQGQYTPLNPFTKFEEMRKNSLDLTKGKDTLQKALTYVMPVKAVYTNGNLEFKDLKTLSTILAVLLDERSFAEFSKSADVHKESIVAMAYVRKKFNIEGHEVSIVIIRENEFLKNTALYNSLLFSHELLHLIQDRIRKNPDGGRKIREIESYTLMNNMFLKSLSKTKLKRWKELEKEVQSMSIDNIHKNPKYPDICKKEFGDDKLVNVLIVCAFTPIKFVNKYYR